MSNVLGMFLKILECMCRNVNSGFFFQQAFIIADAGVGPGWHLRIAVEEMASSSNTLDLEGRVCLGFSPSLPSIIKTALLTGDKILKYASMAVEHSLDFHRIYGTWKHQLFSALGSF